MTGILVTVCGTPVWTPSSVRQVLESGVDSFRITPVFRSQQANLELVSLLRDTGRDMGVPVFIYYDVSRGSKIRTTNTKPIELPTGRSVTLGHAAHCDVRSERAIPRVLDDGSVVYLGDAELVLRVEGRIHDGSYRCHVVNGGTLRAHKGITARKVDLGLGALNSENEKDLEFVRDQSLEFVLLSFVKTADEISACRSKIPSTTQVAVKIETTDALRNLEQITERADVVMVARGDLALQAGYESMALLQWRIAEVAKACGKPFIVATQMFETAMTRIVPGRSDIVDMSVAAAMGAHSIMLGPETCMNPDHVQIIDTAQRILAEVDKSSMRLRLTDEH